MRGSDSGLTKECGSIHSHAERGAIGHRSMVVSMIGFDEAETYNRAHDAPTLILQYCEQASYSLQCKKSSSSRGG